MVLGDETLRVFVCLFVCLCVCVCVSRLIYKPFIVSCNRISGKFPFIGIGTKHSFPIFVFVITRRALFFRTLFEIMYIVFNNLQKKLKKDCSYNIKLEYCKLPNVIIIIY